MRTDRTTARDYPTVMAMLAMLLNAIVIGGIIYSYAGRRSPDDISAHISILHRQLPSDL